MNRDAKAAIREWNEEVDNEMARLIRSGVPPWEAAPRAADFVKARRRSEAQQQPKAET